MERGKKCWFYGYVIKTQKNIQASNSYSSLNLSIMARGVGFNLYRIERLREFSFIRWQLTIAFVNWQMCSVQLWGYFLLYKLDIAWSNKKSLPENASSQFHDIDEFIYRQLRNRKSFTHQYMFINCNVDRKLTRDTIKVKVNTYAHYY